MQTNIEAFLTHDDAMMRQSYAVVGTPCADCEALITGDIGWPYWQFVRSGAGETWPENVLRVPRAEWRYSFVPSIPPGIPILFTYGTCQDNTGCRGCPPCEDRSDYVEYYLPWIEWVDRHGDGFRSVAIDGADHWHMCRASAQTNAAIQQWFEDLDQRSGGVAVVGRLRSPQWWWRRCAGGRCDLAPPSSHYWAWGGVERAVGRRPPHPKIPARDPV